MAEEVAGRGRVRAQIPEAVGARSNVGEPYDPIAETLGVPDRWVPIDIVPPRLLRIGMAWDF